VNDQLASEIRELRESVDSIKNNVAPKKQPKDLKEALGLPEDFVPDMDEAIRNPDSDSGRYLRAMIKIEANREAEGIVRAQTTKEKEKKFREEFNYVDEKAWKDFLDYASIPLSYEDVHYLKNRKQIEADIVKRANGLTNEQRKEVNRTPVCSSSETEKTLAEMTDRGIFKTIFNKGDGGSSAGFFSPVPK
jgi:hypothetical protein